MKKSPSPSGFGLIIIGNEILDARRQDVHFANAIALLHERNTALSWTLFLPDNSAILKAQLQWAMAQQEPFFCCGGIGSTPDDITRQCTAEVIDVPLEFHPEGVTILKNKFKENATPARLRMVEFPKGATLIPNPINQVPGFSIKNGYFLPGFPEMASPMMRWVLERCYEPGEENTASTLILPNAKEADLVDVMEEFVETHPDVSFSSLPRFTKTGTEVHIGLAGTPEAVEKGLDYLTADLTRLNITYREQD